MSHPMDERVDESVDGATVADVMTHEVLCVTADLPVEELLAVLLGQGVSGAPVLDGSQVVGVVSVVDLLRTLRRDEAREAQLTTFYLSPTPFAPLSLGRISTLAPPSWAHWRVRDIMTTRLLTVSPADPLEAAARTMLHERVHRLLVIDGHRLVGVVTALDLLSGFRRDPCVRTDRSEHRGRVAVPVRGTKCPDTAEDPASTMDGVGEDQQPLVEVPDD